jgi:hypothetical protein
MRGVEYTPDSVNMSLSIAFRSFFATLFNRETSERVAQALAGGSVRFPAGDPASQQRPTAPAKIEPPPRSEALTLLAALQREARFVDFVKESLDGASDEQIGAVVRDVHRDCGKVLERMFSIRPLVEQEEGAPIEVPAGFDSARFHLTGNVQGVPPYRGKLGHHGWQATQAEVPTWNGQRESARVISPADVEL